MKRYLLFIFVALILLCTGCQNSSKDKLVICTDTYLYPTVKDAVEKWKKENREGSSIQTVIVKIPSDETAAEIKIAEIRTEIMAGDGPDLFIIRVPSYTVIPEDRPESLLFSNPEKAMYSDIFLPLDSYLEEFEYLDIDNCNQAILKAGQTEEGQMLLPLLYDYEACLFPVEENEESSSYPRSFEEILWNEQMRVAIHKQNSIIAFFSSLGSYADYKNEELLVSKEDIKKTFELGLTRESSWNAVELNHVSFLDADLKHKSESYNIYAVPNIYGGVTGRIQTSAGINKNTRVADEAASFLDTYCEIFSTSAVASANGMFIEFSDQIINNLRTDSISEENIEDMIRMNNSITDVRFYSMWDYYIADTFWKQYYGAQDPTLEAAIDEIYNKMQMQMKE